MMLVIASSTARVMDRHSAAANPNVSVSRSIAPRMTHNIFGSLRNSSFSNSSRLMRRLVPCQHTLSGAPGGRKIIMRQLRRLLREVVRRLQVRSKKSHLAVDVALEQRLSP